jgi:hypothetical protein
MGTVIRDGGATANISSKAGLVHQKSSSEEDGRD